MKGELTVVTGAGGFIGGNLIAALRQQGNRQIRAVDVKPLGHWYQKFDDVENFSLDLNSKENCEVAAKDATEVYNLAANMGGMGFIEKNKALCMLSVLINTHSLWQRGNLELNAISIPHRLAFITAICSTRPMKGTGLLRRR
jgi:GDP-D-mannose 3',5'-epimerase